MPSPSYITIPRTEYEAILREVRRASELTAEEGPLRRRIRALEPRLVPPRVDLALALESAEEAARSVLRIDQRLRLYDQELTPVRPPSQADIQQAFENAAEFAQGKKKP